MSTNALMAGVAVLLLVAVAAPLATGYVITVDAHAEECFFDRIEAGTKSGVTFETIEGGFLDIDITIHDPDRNNIYTGDHETSGKYAFTAHKTGIYTFCFSNKMSTITPKMVMFNIDIGAAPAGTVGAVNEPEANHTKLEEMIRDLAGTLTGVKHEQEYMSVRDKIHRAINEATNSRVMLWSIFEAVILVAMSIGQVYYLKRFFEVRRVV